jgi:hypothetical protein
MGNSLSYYRNYQFALVRFNCTKNLSRFGLQDKFKEKGDIIYTKFLDKGSPFSYAEMLG